MFLFTRYVANKLAFDEENQQLPPAQMQQSTRSEDVDMESNEGRRSDSCGSLDGVVSTDGESIDELSVKFSVQGTSSSETSGKKKVVSN